MIQRPVPPAQLHMPRAPHRQGGFTFLWLLFLVAGLGVGMAAIGTLWHTAAQREKEQQLLFVGNEYRRAIESFLKIPLPPGQQARLPKALDELLLDPRFPHTVRHLRRLYPDPITGNEDWGLLKDAQGGIGGVYSLSEEKPMKTAGFAAANADFANQPSYRGWVFQAAAGAVAGVANSGGGANLPLQEQTLSPPASNPGGGNAAQESDQRALERARRIAACSTAQLQNNLACGGLLDQGDRAGWQACMAVAANTYNACLAGN